MPTRQPEVVNLLSSQITRLETNLTAQIHDSKVDLGERIAELATRVGVQNGRVSKLESSIARMEVEVNADLAKPTITRRQAAMIGTGGIVSGAALAELLGNIGEILHKIGFLG